MNQRFRLTTLALVSAAALAITPAFAQTMKPGLWESTSKTTSADPETNKAMAESLKQMAKMPAAQRKEMEKSMNQPGGPVMTMNADGSITVKTCISQKQIDAGANIGVDDGNCKYKQGANVGGTQTYSYACATPPSSGEGKTVYQGNDYTSTVKMSTTASGKKDVMTSETKGKWLGADCGAIKPVDIKPTPAKK
ncbi:DUF3617 domain-containing protein [Massilia sp. CCM 8734]|uniref:DUF3617 domain-containing protein n=1 Tax=Massilia sp. CCM 8734 TaxID=2609283 RepID=UPI0014242248|nr:DUF3617 domain-containing protein [Massilia sp. CCM 8734]NHZ99299.1 DUF3617 family protein [Massilia sp. CCM 8734]